MIKFVSLASSYYNGYGCAIKNSIDNHTNCINETHFLIGWFVL